MALVESPVLVVGLIILIFFLGSSIKILKEYERAVIFRLGKPARAVFNPGGDGSGPGLMFVIPLIDKVVKVSLKPVAVDLPSQEALTQDSAFVRVNAAIHVRPTDPKRAVIAVENYLQEAARIAQEPLRYVLRRISLEDLVTYREKTGERIQAAINEAADRIGVQVTKVEIKSVDIIKK